MPVVMPISDLQRNMAEITRECQESGKPIYLTKNGTAALVIMDAASFDSEMAVHQAVLDRETRVYNAIMRGYDDAQVGRTRSLAQAREDAAAAREARHAR